jgi:hypothetical protein
MGFPLTQLAIARLGRWGAVLAECASVALLVRAAALIAGGAPRELRPALSALLYVELVVAAIASLTGLRLLRGDAHQMATERETKDPLEIARRASMGTLFGIHTSRLWAYMRSDRSQTT